MTNFNVIVALKKSVIADTQEEALERALEEVRLGISSPDMIVQVSKVEDTREFLSSQVPTFYDPSF